jgi:hypothetical protein
MKTWLWLVAGVLVLTVPTCACGNSIPIPLEESGSVTDPGILRWTGKSYRGWFDYGVRHTIVFETRSGRLQAFADGLREADTRVDAGGGAVGPRGGYGASHWTSP